MKVKDVFLDNVNKSIEETFRWMDSELCYLEEVLQGAKKEAKELMDECENINDDLADKAFDVWDTINTALKQLKELQ